MNMTRFFPLVNFCTSLLLAKNVPVKAIQEWLGHSTYSTTANLYTHLESNTKNISTNKFQEETYTFIDPVKQLEHEELEKEWDLER